MSVGPASTGPDTPRHRSGVTPSRSLIGVNPNGHGL